MKVLQALVGYLAVIASAMPYPFAIASPLEIHYDGYVNSTTMQNTIDGALMEHFLGTIVETCKMNTTLWNTHGDSALMKRVPGDIQIIDLEARQAEAAGFIPVVAIISIIVGGVIAGVLLSRGDNPVICNAEFPVKTLIKSLLPETNSIYPKYYQPDVCEISTQQLGYLPLQLFGRFRWSWGHGLWLHPSRTTDFAW